MRCRHSVFLIVVLFTTATFTQQPAGDSAEDDVVITNEEDPIPDPPTLEDVDDGYRSPYIEHGSFLLREHFDDEHDVNSKWIRSAAKKDDAFAEIAQYDGVWGVEAPVRRIFKDDLGLVLKSKVKHAAISSKLVEPFVFGSRPLIVQYEVQLQDGQECGGSYLKLLSKGQGSLDLKQVHL